MLLSASSLIYQLILIKLGSRRFYYEIAVLKKKSSFSHKKSFLIKSKVQTVLQIFPSKSNRMRVFVIFFALLLSSSAAFASSAAQTMNTTMSIEAVAAPQAVKQKKTLKEKMTLMLAKKLYKKAQRKAKKKGMKPMAEFVDFVALAGAIVCIAGIISIIGSVVTGLITAGVGLLIYALAKAGGGSIGGVFS